MKKFFLALSFALSLFVAAAYEFPKDGSVLITAEDGTIVGVGKFVDGEEFELEVLVDFTGFGKLVFTTPGGSTQMLDVMIGEGVVTVDLMDLELVLSDAGFTEVSITTDDSLALAGKPENTGRPEGAGRSDDAGAEDQEPNEHANDNANEGAENAGQGQDNANENASEGAENAGQGSDNADENAGDDANENAGEGAGNADQGSDNADDSADDNAGEHDEDAGEGQNPGYGQGNNPGQGNRP